MRIGQLLVLTLLVLMPRAGRAQPATGEAYVRVLAGGFALDLPRGWAVDPANHGVDAWPAGEHARRIWLEVSDATDPAAARRALFERSGGTWRLRGSQGAGVDLYDATTDGAAVPCVVITVQVRGGHRVAIAGGTTWWTPAGIAQLTRMARSLNRTGRSPQRFAALASSAVSAGPLVRERVGVYETVRLEGWTTEAHERGFAVKGTFRGRRARLLHLVVPLRSSEPPAAQVRDYIASALPGPIVDILAVEATGDGRAVRRWPTAATAGSGCRLDPRVHRSSSTCSPCSAGMRATRSSPRPAGCSRCSRPRCRPEPASATRLGRRRSPAPAPTPAPVTSLEGVWRYESHRFTNMYTDTMWELWDKFYVFHADGRVETLFHREVGVGCSWERTRGRYRIDGEQIIFHDMEHYSDGKWQRFEGRALGWKRDGADSFVVPEPKYALDRQGLFPPPDREPTFERQKDRQDFDKYWKQSFVERP